MVVNARFTQAHRDFSTAILRFEEAAALQDTLAYTEPPYWYYPVRQSLGAALVQAGRLAEAEDQFVGALKRAPHNGWSYFGLSEVYKAQGATDKLQKAEMDIVKTWIGGRELLELSRL
jgi:predicted Zn-dependent protease